MFNKFEEIIKKRFSNNPATSPTDPEIDNNPLIGYLKIFQNQHKVIIILYRSLIWAFTGFLLLLSLLIVNILSNEFVPFWGIFGLGIIDGLLFLGIFKAFQELKRYKKKSATILNHVYEYLKKDLSKLEKIKLEHAFINDTHKKIQEKIQLLTKDLLQVKGKSYQGWDKQVCPGCKTTLEMMMKKCPHCNFDLGDAFHN